MYYFPYATFLVFPRVAFQIRYVYWNPCLGFTSGGKQKLESVRFVCLFNLQRGANNLWSPRVFICELPKGKDRLECGRTYGGSSDPWGEDQCWARIWKDLREKLDRPRTVDVAPWSLERGNCMTLSFLGSSWWVADCKSWKPQKTLSTFSKTVFNQIYCQLLVLPV